MSAQPRGVHTCRLPLLAATSKSGGEPHWEPLSRLDRLGSHLDGGPAVLRCGTVVPIRLRGTSVCFPSHGRQDANVAFGPCKEKVTPVVTYDWCGPGSSGRSPPAVRSVSTATCCVLWPLREDGEMTAAFPLLLAAQPTPSLHLRPSCRTLCYVSVLARGPRSPLAPWPAVLRAWPPLSLRPCLL